MLRGWSPNPGGMAHVGGVAGDSARSFCMRPLGTCMVESALTAPRMGGLFSMRRAERVVSWAARQTAGSKSSTSSQRSFCTRVPRTERSDWARISATEPFFSSRRRRGGARRRAWGEVFVEDGLAEVGVHFVGLFEAAAEDADLDAGLEEQIEEGGECAEHGFSAAAAGPDGGIGGVFGFEKGVGEVVDGGLVAGAGSVPGEGECRGRASRRVLRGWREDGGIVEFW